MQTDLIATVTARWSDPARRPLFKRLLVDTSGEAPCFCAQGDLLHYDLGWTIERLRDVEQADADKAVAEALGISRLHAILLRIVNDSRDGCPQDVLLAPEKVLGGKAQTILAFGRHLDAMTLADWAAGAAAGAAGVDAARAAARDAVWDAGGGAGVDAGVDAARNAARDAAWAAGGGAARDAWEEWEAWEAARDVAWDAAWAVGEIMGGDLIRERGQPFFFLPLFGFADPEAVLAKEGR